MFKPQELIPTLKFRVFLNRKPISSFYSICVYMREKETLTMHRPTSCALRMFRTSLLRMHVRLYSLAELNGQ